jgi:hypothetical protein
MKGVLAAAIIALMTVTAYAQGMGGMGGRGGKHRHGQERSVSKKKANDINAKSPLERLPDKPYDPWRVVRDPVPAPK